MLGYLDDLLVVRLSPPELLVEYRAVAARRSTRPVNLAAAALMITL